MFLAFLGKHLNNFTHKSQEMKKFFENPVVFFFFVKMVLLYFIQKNYVFMF